MQETINKRYRRGLESTLKTIIQSFDSFFLDYQRFLRKEDRNFDKRICQSKRRDTRCASPNGALELGQPRGQELAGELRLQRQEYGLKHRRKKCSAHKEQIWPECKLGFTPQYSPTTFSFSSTVKQRRMGGLGKWGMAEHTAKYTTKYLPQRQMEVAAPTHSSEKLGLSLFKRCRRRSNAYMIEFGGIVTQTMHATRLADWWSSLAMDWQAEC